MEDRLFISLDKLVNLVEVEHRYQVDKWGIQDHDPFEWMTITTEEVGELAHALQEHYYRGGSKEDVVSEAIQVATLALKIAEMHLD